MADRDDREALRARVEKLEREREGAREELDRLRRSIPAGGRPGRRGLLGPSAVGHSVGLLVVGVLLLVGMVFWLLVPPESSAPVVEAPREEPGPAAGGGAGAPRAVRRVLASWTGTVSRVEGRDLAVGTACTVTGEFAGDGSRVTPDVTIVCGDERLYRWSDPIGEGTETRSCDVVEERADAPDEYRYRLRCDDHGARSGGRPELTVDTRQKRAAVFRDAAPAFRVEIDVEEWSSPRTGPSLY